jgi:hypothetical protein
MRKTLLVIAWHIISCCLVFGCLSKTENVDLWEGKKYQLIAETIDTDEPIFSAWPIVQTKEHFIIRQQENTKQFSVFHLKGDSLLYDGAFLTLGRGPFEVNEGSVHYVPENQSIVVVGKNVHGKIINIPIDNISNLFSHDVWHEYNNSTLLAPVMDIIPIDTLSYLLRIIHEKKMFAMFSIQSSKLTELNTEYPDDIVAPAWEKAASVYGGQVAKRVWHNQFAYSSDNGHYVAVYTYDDSGQIVKETVLFNELPEYFVSGNKVSKTDDCIDGLSLAVSENYIYLGDKNLTIYDYRSRSAMRKNGYPAGYSKTIYVCGWDGKYIAKYELDRAAVYFSVNYNDEHLYAFSFNSDTFESEIVRFKLPIIQ